MLTLCEEDVGEGDRDGDAALVPAVHELHAHLQVLVPGSERLERRVRRRHPQPGHLVRQQRVEHLQQHERQRQSALSTVRYVAHRGGGSSGSNDDGGGRG